MCQDEDFASTQMQQRHLQLTNSFYQLSVAGCLGFWTKRILWTWAGSAGKSILTDSQGNKVVLPQPPQTSMHYNDSWISLELCAQLQGLFLRFLQSFRIQQQCSLRHSGLIPTIMQGGLYLPLRIYISHPNLRHQVKTHVREEGVEKQRALIRKSPGWLGQAACNLSTCWVILARFLSIPKASLTGSRPGLRRLGSALPPKAAVPLLSSSLVLLRSAQ